MLFITNTPMQAYIEAENARLEAEGQFWAKEIVVRIEYKYCPNLTIIDTPGRGQDSIESGFAHAAVVANGRPDAVGPRFIINAITMRSSQQARPQLAGLQPPSIYVSIIEYFSLPGRRPDQRRARQEEQQPADRQPPGGGHGEEQDEPAGVHHPVPGGHLRLEQRQHAPHRAAGARRIILACDIALALPCDLSCVVAVVTGILCITMPFLYMPR